jgi:hypothetical protein
LCNQVIISIVGHLFATRFTGQESAVVTSHLSQHDFLQDLLLLENSRIDQGQQQLIERLRRHVRELWRHVQRLESVLSCTKNDLVLKIGDASLVMKKDGTILIEGRNLSVKASGRAEIKAMTSLTLKSPKIEES